MPSELVSLTRAVSDLREELASSEAVLSSFAGVQNDSDARAADAALARAKAVMKAVHDQRMAITRRVDAFKKSVISEEADICAGVSSQVERVKSLQVAYLTAKADAERAAIREEEEQLAEELEAARREAEIEAKITGREVSVPEYVATGQTARGPVVTGVRARTIWAFEIADADSVPRAYCRPDESAICAYMDAAKKAGADIGGVSIPGVRFFTRISV